MNGKEPIVREMEADDDDFCDAISVSSSFVPRRDGAGKDYISLSRNTVYHSVIDLELSEMNAGDNPRTSAVDQHNKVHDGQPSKAVTYSQWRKRNWRNFTHGGHQVDFVLAYTNEDHQHRSKRETFEKNLVSKGLLLESEKKQKIHFVKIHAPKQVLCCFSEILKIRFPIKDDIEIKDEEKEPFIHGIKLVIKKFLDCFGVRLDPKKFPDRAYKLTSEYSRDKTYLFDVDQDHFFSASTRYFIVAYILGVTKYNDDSHAAEDVGIKKLLAENVYTAAYPLHDGDTDTEGTERSKLLDEWASVSKWIKFQPIDSIRDYFGVKFAFYFAWLGFYTHMLIPASIVGILCTIYGILTLPDDRLSKDICNENLNITMCPACDQVCDYRKLSDTCTFSKINYVIDNPATIVFAVFMSLWSTLYLELWKRYSAGITHRWGLTGYDLEAEPPRNEYLTRLANAKKKKLNVVTQLKEPVPPFWRVKLPSIILSFSVALMMMLLGIAVVGGIVLYRMALLSSKNLYGEKDYKIYVVPITAGVINLVCITLLNYMYDYLAEWLTEMELHRTQTQYDDSITLKIYMFQFVNYYSSIFYIAFLKGKFVGYPQKYNKVFGYRQEECNPGGCLMELFIQLAIIMVGKQALDGILEMVIPLLTKMYNTIKIKAGIEEEKEEDTVICCNQWTEDYKLLNWGPRNLFGEYLEMILQYGFVTIFVTAFPLAPLFALLNNILEMRLDAKKFLKYYKRPVPQRVCSIGIWYRVMDVVSRISVVTNAFIIAFSSNFIPKMVYMLKFSYDGTDAGYLSHTLTSFNVSDFAPETAPIQSSYDGDICYFNEYRNNHDQPDKYKRPLIYWHILAARLAFVVVFQNVVSFIMMGIQWAIPDMPRKLRDQIKREAYKTNQIIIQFETNKNIARIAGRAHNRDSILSDQSEYKDVISEMGDASNGLYHRHSSYNPREVETYMDVA